MSFYVTHDQGVWRFYTEVGNDLAKPVFEELQPPQESESLEASEEE